MGNGPSLGNRFLFPAPNPSYDESLENLIWIPEEFGFRKKRWKYKSFPALWIKSPKPTRCVIVYFHANSCDLGHIRPELQVISEFLNVSICAIEFPGYGIPPHHAYPPEYPNADDINRRAVSTFNLLVNIGVPATSIVFFGRSIGTGPACKIAANIAKRGIRIGGVVLHAPYMSIHKIVQDYSVLGTWIIDNYWDNEASLSEMAPDTPLLIIHGLDDEIIGVTHGKTLYENYKSTLKKGSFPADSYHNDFYLIDDVAMPIGEFLDTLSYSKDNGEFDIDLPKGFTLKPDFSSEFVRSRSTIDAEGNRNSRSNSLPAFSEDSYNKSVDSKSDNKSESARVPSSVDDNLSNDKEKFSSVHGVFRRTVNPLSQRSNSKNSARVIDEKPLSNYLDRLTERGVISREFVDELVCHVHENVNGFDEQMEDKN